MKNKQAKALIGLLVVAALLSVQTASAGSMGGEDSFDTATQIEPGYYEDEITQAEERYSYIVIKPGQELVLKITLDEYKVSRGSCHLEVAVFDDDRSQITEMDVWRAETTSFYFSASSKKDSYRFYIKIEPDYGSESLHAKYHTKVLIEDHFDANSGTDAGDIFNDAIPVSPGSYEGYLSVNQKSGNDQKDYYKLSIQSGDKVNVALTPSEEVRLSLSIYNEDRECVKTAESKEGGAIARTMWLAQSSQDIYILAKGRYDDDGGDYSLDITTGKAPLRERGIGSESEEQPGFGGFLALICLIVVYIGLRIKGGKNRIG